LVSGSAAAVEALAGRLAQEGVLCGLLPVPRAVHSAHTEPILAALAAAIGRLELHAPAIPYLSNVTGTWITAAEATDPAYWVRHLREPVRFSGGLDHLLAEPGTVLLEVGAGRALTALAKRHPLADSAAALLTSLPPREEPRPAGAFFQTALGRLWLTGAAVDWNASHRNAARQRIHLPAYPFERAGNACTTPEIPTLSAPPQGETEQRLAAIWSALLGVDRVGRHDNFFELGGHSLLALSLIGRVERELGSKITLATLASAPTVAGLALRLGGGSQHSTLVALRTGGSAAPFFCVHPAGGHVLCYADLARHLAPERPFFGLQIPEVEDDEPLPDIPGLAALYVHAVVEAWPAGPLFLGGWSMGGVIAFEMARQLAALGRPVALVALLDADAPGQDSAAQAAAEAEDLLLFARALELTQNGTPLWATGNGDALRWIAGRLEENGVLTGGDALAQVRRMHRTFVHCLHITTAYEPQPYTGPAAVFRVRDRPMGGTGAPGLGWENVCSRLEVQELPGNHWSLFREPLVRGLAARLSLCLTHAEITEITEISEITESREESR
ncbi:MAG TPA: thioesterase domain-containing protein, partial [Thermoanaerobaculia bacterium]